MKIIYQWQLTVFKREKEIEVEMVALEKLKDYRTLVKHEGTKIISVEKEKEEDNYKRKRKQVHEFAGIPLPIEPPQSGESDQSQND